MEKFAILALLLCLTSLTGVTDAATVTVTPSFRYNCCGADGHRIIMVNYNNATNPSYSDLVAAVKADNTDAHIYGINTYKCTDYAEEIHNNLEKRGLKCGIASVQFNTGKGHAVNVVNTTDKGNVYVDCSGTEGNPGMDTIATIEVGKKYTITPIDDSNSIVRNRIVKSVRVYW